MQGDNTQVVGDMLTWRALRVAIQRAPTRSDAWRLAGSWAIDVLEDELGTDWPRTVVSKSSEGSAGELALVAGHTIAYTNLLELALRLTLLSKVPGFAKARRPIATDPRIDQLAHSRIQLEVAALAEQAECLGALEPNPLGPRPADVAIEVLGTQHVVETRAIMTGEIWRSQVRTTDDLFERIHALERTYDVQCAGSITDHLGGLESQALLVSLEERARLVAVGAWAPPVHMAGVVLEVLPTSAKAPEGLHGPDMRGDSWGRIEPRIREKAERAVESGANWLRLDALNGLWQFTRWARLPLAAKLRSIIGPARLSLGPLDGIVISSGALLEQGEFEDATVELADGSVALRRRVTPQRVRETMIIANSANASSVVQRWRSLYDGEPGWLAYALERVDLPMPGVLFA
jgi:hypothetical protein